MYEHHNPQSGQSPAQENPFESPLADNYAPDDYAADDPETRQWALILHLSQFAGYIIPLGGFLVPLIIWQIKKETLPGIDEHGREVMNWVISEVIYFFGAIVLCTVLIGIPMLIAIIIAGIVFPIIAAIKASDGECWRYPLNLRFF